MDSQPTPALTVNEIKAQMHARGVTITDWADRHGFSRATTYAVLAGRVKGVRGEAYQIACALGLVEPPDDGECRWLRSGGDEIAKGFVGERNTKAQTLCKE